MRFPGFIGSSYTLSSVNFDCQRCINLYPEFDERKTGKDGEAAALVGTPGLALLATIGAGPMRGMWMTSTGVLYVVSGSTVYSVTSAWVATSVGTLLTSTGTVGMADNGLILIIVDGPNGYYLNFPGGTITQIVDPLWKGSNVVTYQDSYFIFAAPNSNVFYASDPLAITFLVDIAASKEGSPDNIVSIISTNRNLVLFGDQTTEVWFDAGTQASAPFQYIQGTFAQYGCAAAFSVAKMANTIFWLGKDVTGTGMVFMANGYSPQRISTHAVEIAMQGYSTISDAIGFSYQDRGHTFYVLTFPSGNATWVFDSATSLWHERGYLSQGVLQRHRANCYAFAYGSHIVGDWQNGNLYQMSDSVYTDNGTPISRQRIAPHLSSDMKRIFFQQFQLDLESGTGLDGSGQGINPQAILTWSNDGGHTWSSEIWASFGAIGATKKRAIWRRLGQSRNRVFKVTITDPVKVVLIGAEIDVMAGAS